MLRLLTSILALSLTATASSAKYSLYNRLLQLDSGLRQTHNLLNRVSREAQNAAPADIVNSYNTTIVEGTNTLQQPFSWPCAESTQFVLCLAYHTFAITSISLYEDLTEDADKFDWHLRSGFQSGFMQIYNENNFVAQIAPHGLPRCLESIQLDDSLMNQAFITAFDALNPSAAPS
ncbi:uncharacterized protein BJX67DRAFT_137167 [Aspergillus lucknowensis]|uniref:Uncharacterized protein n=1 Tax=Aspergillus lucknowensis TaxID=176173 RepID=A0ABR4LSM3_9EURO